MAVIKNGKIHGKIGRYIYRVIDGKEIIQSSPLKVNLTKNTKIENRRFGKSSKVNAKIYRLVKDFALAKTDGHFYTNLQSLIRTSFFSVRPITSDLSFTEWKLIPKSMGIAINQYLKIEEIVHNPPFVIIEDNTCMVSIPQYKYKRRWSNFIAETEYLEYSVTIVHYDFQNDQATVLHDYNSGRFPRTADFPEQLIEIPLTSHNEPVKNGLILVCMAIRLFALKESYGYLNTKECNPVSMVGAYFKV